ncbi:MAG: RNA polymerase sigma factor [Pseudomonadota bacterium]
MERASLMAQTEAPDEVLLRRFGAGEAVAARELSERLVPRLLGYASRLLGDPAEAEDVVQEAMLRLWRIAPEWESGRAQVSTWVYRVTTNLCTDRLRRGGRQKPTAPEDMVGFADPAPGAEGVLDATEKAAALQAALQELPERQRQAVVLRHIEGLSNPEIAVIMDTGVEAVESLTARGKRALTAALMPHREEYGYQDD